MPTFRSKEIVDARQFIGDIDNAKELVAWVKAKTDEYSSSNLSVAEGRNTLGSNHPTIYIATPLLTITFGHSPKEWWSLRLYPHDWLVQHQDGTLVNMPDKQFKEQYEQV